MHYLVLGGGSSSEKEVSSRSAAAVTRALAQLGHNVTNLDPSRASLEDILQVAQHCDGTFPILHGAGGEDGQLQAHFAEHGIAYFGPSAASCHDTFDKTIFKTILEANGLPTPKWNTVTANELSREPLAMKPFVLKPISGGSSIDTFIIRAIPFESAPLLEALSRYGTMLIEELIEGSEITVGILESTPLPVVEIIPPSDQEFDYENKYNGATKELCPPQNVSPEIQARAQQLALVVHEATRCRHLSRTDILINPTGELFVIDTNTIPGLTDQSLYPKAAAEAGYSRQALMEKFISLM